MSNINAIIIGIIILIIIIKDWMHKSMMYFQRKILCRLNLRHIFKQDNNGISLKFISMNMNYSKCECCNRFKVIHEMPVPDTYVKELLRQKRIYELTCYKRHVMVEKKV